VAKYSNDGAAMRVEVTSAEPDAVGADWVAAAGPAAARLGAPERALADADPVAIVYREQGPLAVVATEPDAEGLRTAAARAVRACRGGGTVAWALDTHIPVPLDEQVRALSEGAVIGGYDGRRWTSTKLKPSVERFVICGAGADMDPVAQRASLVARWTNTARELVDAPANIISPSGLAERVSSFGGLTVQIVDPAAAGLGALSAVGGSSPQPPVLIVLRHEPPQPQQPAGGAPRLALIGKAVTFDTGGYFLKPQHDIVRQKADMGGGAAVVAALGAIAELGLPVSVMGVVPACENMLSGTAIRPTDVITTAAGLTVEVNNPDAEGRLILADALWYARQQDATHLVDLATLTGAMRAGMGDLYAGVFSPDEAWRETVVAAGNASGDLAWPWPLHPRYRPLIDSAVADLRNTAGRGFGYPIVAATFLAQFAGDGPWAHVDMLGPALLDEDRGDAFGAGASGYGVRLLVELATRLSAATAA
jgi:leucyl aminopeptidase